ncbi:MAG: hypothetical protein KDK36_06175 [Leptospiraceae bacterium]|nr:hypothetical protein [Leptospiraceae bacterium]
MVGLDLSKIPFFTFAVVYGIICFGLIIFTFFIPGWIEAAKPYAMGFGICFFVQYLVNSGKVFFMNEQWSTSPVAVQLFLTLISFFLNIAIIYYFSLISKNIPAIIGFFIAYYINLKIIVLIAHFLKRNPEND